MSHPWELTYQNILKSTLFRKEKNLQEISYLRFDFLPVYSNRDTKIYIFNKINFQIIIFYLLVS